ncbi:MAG: ribonuclease HII [Omnitrophica WOR_2 bacterium RIFCSPHIGHO2_02_FULL_68_15]|nr:MAG: ribonuclease HII [Omnitrophica WOR_2 bacterium RIFCSPHIGHO2_02_FULL_68_15]
MRSRSSQARRLDQLRRFDRQFRRPRAPHRIAGVDEAGRGPLAGPVVAGAVVLRRSAFTVPVDDSKRLSPRARRRAFFAILACADVGIGIVEPSAIDTRNIFHASLEAMRQAVLHLPESPDRLLIDGPWTVPGLDLPMTPVVHGDRRSLAIACASIVAKVVRDELMCWYDREHPVYGFARHKGYPTAAHLAALVAHGPSPIHRRSFRPVAALLT